MKYLTLIFMLIGGNAYSQPDTTKVSPVRIQDLEERITTLENSLDNYKKDKGGAAILHFMGGIALGVYFVGQNAYVNKIKEGDLKAKAPSPIIAIAGAGLLSLGFVVDMNAVEKLKRKRK